LKGEENKGKKKEKGNNQNRQKGKRIGGSEKSEVTVPKSDKGPGEIYGCHDTADQGLNKKKGERRLNPKWGAKHT